MMVKNCTATERILLHLLDYLKNDYETEMPIEITQEGIAKVTCIQRKHLPRSLKKLIQHDLIYEKRSHVRGKKQIMKTYYLTSEGRKEAIRIKNKIADYETICITNGEKQSYSISEIYDLYKKDYSYSCIISQVIKHSCFNEKNIKIKRNEKDIFSKFSAEKIYKEALEEAWKDGVLTVDERNILSK